MRQTFQHFSTLQLRELFETGRHSVRKRSPESQASKRAQKSWKMDENG